MWYAASLLFKSTHSLSIDKEDLWEESILLIQANDVREAEQKATSLGRQNEHSYVGQGSDVVSWKFVQIERVFEIEGDALVDGSEVFSRFLRSSEVASLLKPFEDE